MMKILTRNILGVLGLGLCIIHARVVRGDSWSGRAIRARSAFRLCYEPYQGVVTVGFRVVCPVAEFKLGVPALAGGTLQAH